MPLHYKKLSRIDWKPVEEKVERKCPWWQGGLLSFGGRIILTKTCLSNVPGFIISLFRVTKGVLKGLISLEHGCYGKKKTGLENITLLNGRMFVNQETREVWVLLI
jgi:hypothetical protein